MLAKSFYEEFYTPLIGEENKNTIADFLNFEVISSEIREKTKQYYLIFEDKKEIGTLQTGFKDDYLQIFEIYLDKEYRNKGILHFTIGELKKIAQKKQVSRLKICIPEKSSTLCEIFKKTGFKKTESIARYLGDL